MQLKTSKVSIKYCGVVSFKAEEIMAWGIVVILYYAIFNGGILAVCNLLSLPITGIIDSALFIVESTIILVGILFAFQRKMVFSLFLYFIVLMLYLVTLFFFPENQSVLLGTARTMFVFCLPICIFAYCLQDVENLWELICKYAPLIIILGLIYSVYHNNMDIDQTYSMWLGYQLTLPTISIIWMAFNKKTSMVYLILSCIGIVNILLNGSRGPLIIVTVYFAVCLFMYKVRSNVNTGNFNIKVKIGKYYYSILGFILLIAFVLGIVYVLVNIQTIAGNLYTYFLIRGRDVRTLRVLAMDNSLHYVSGRDILYEAAYKLIKNRLFIGYGLSGDCVQIAKILGYSTDSAGGMYAHNMMLELMIHFGAIIGGGLYAIYLILIMKKIYKLQSYSAESSLLLAIFIYGIIMSMISTNYLETPLLWMILGIALRKQN